jgi:hypothetical protein
MLLLKFGVDESALQLAKNCAYTNCLVKEIVYFSPVREMLLNRYNQH